METDIDMDNAPSVVKGLSGELLPGGAIMAPCIMPLWGVTGDRGPDISTAMLGLMSGEPSRLCTPGGRLVSDI